MTEEAPITCPLCGRNNEQITSLRGNTLADPCRNRIAMCFGCTGIFLIVIENGQISTAPVTAEFMTKLPEDILSELYQAKVAVTLARCEGAFKQ